MTSTTVRPDLLTFASTRRAMRRRGVTLVELMISMAISAVALSAIMGSFLFITRSSLLTTSYSGMDTEARVGLEVFGRDARMAESIVGSELYGDKITLRIPTDLTGVNFKTVSYEYDPTTKIFYRNRGVAGERELIRGVDVFVLKHYTIILNPTTGLPEEATVPSETKQIQIQLRAVRSGAARASATNNVISARYVLRNNFQG